MQTVANEWPDEVPIVWSGYEIGEALPFPPDGDQARPELYATSHRQGLYLLHSGPEHDRPCWDEQRALCGVPQNALILGSRSRA